MLTNNIIVLVTHLHNLMGGKTSYDPMIFWPLRNYYMKEEQHHNNIYVRASIHFLTLITTRIKTFTLSTLALIAVKMSYIEIQPTFSYLSPNIAQWLVPVKVVGSSPAWELRYFSE